MKILFVTPRFPYPCFKGDRLRTYHFIKNLSKNHEIDLVSFIERRQELIYIEEMKKYCNSIQTVLMPKYWSYFKMITGIFSKEPFQVKYYSSKRMENVIKGIIANDKYDIIHIVLQRMMQYAKNLIRTPKIIDYIDALSLNMERRYKRENNYIKKIIFHLEWQRMKMHEKRENYINSYSIVTSKVDKEVLNSENIRVISVGVDSEYFIPRKTTKDIDLIFTGNMDYFPNIDAVLYFHKYIFPKIKEAFEMIKFYIVGISPSKAVRNIENKKNIFVTGFVEDIRYYLNRAKVFVAPLQSGSGVQFKILEAMACSVPVVSTKYGNDGIDAKPGEEIIIANEPKEFESEVINLLKNENKRNYIGNNGRKYVENNFNWKIKTRELESLYKQIIDR